MPKSIENLIARLPLDFRVLYRQFLLRVIDLDALSIQADVVGLLGQFAGVLIMISFIFTAMLIAPTLFMSADQIIVFLKGVLWVMEQRTISTMMLVVGLITVITWDSTFPDRRDAMVLSPLPVASHTILIAKVTASVSILALALLMLNLSTGLALPSLLGPLAGSVWGAPRFFIAYWSTMVASTLFLYGSVLTIQGFTALLLPRRLFLRLSAILQLVAFGLFLGVYFLQPLLPTLADMAAAENHLLLAATPSYWFFAFFNQLNGSLPPQLAWLAWRAWFALGLAVSGAAVSLYLCYVRTMKKTVEEPDLVPGARGFHWTPRLGSALQTAILLFSIRSLTRSRQHRVALAFFLAIVFAIALSWLRSDLAAVAPGPLSMEFLLSTFAMMGLAVFALRSVFSLPISLTANWILQITQLVPSQKYIAATRLTLLSFAVVPVWCVSALLSLAFRPFSQVAAHLVILALVGSILVEASLIGFYKVPFTCSYLPGKSNIQFVFWGAFIAMITVVIPGSEFERSLLGDSLRTIYLSTFLGAVACGLWIFNRYRSKSAVIYFEERPEEIITTLGLIYAPSANTGPTAVHPE